MALVCRDRCADRTPDRMTPLIPFHFRVKIQTGELTCQSSVKPEIPE